MPTSLVTGGAGFIGSHVAKHCLALGHDVVVLDDLSGGFEDNVPAGPTSVGSRSPTSLSSKNCLRNTNSTTSTTWPPMRPRGFPTSFAAITTRTTSSARSIWSTRRSMWKQ